ncbi:MAG: tetratricopeptide repeat protein, partial [Saprospiraceae bacterium]|nr:tetratricopeptide repeat protein [Saprospiraceae bacterium]
YNKDSNDKAIQHFRTALTLDTSFALAYAGLGDAMSQKANYEHKPTLLDSAKMVSQKAIRIDKNCSEGYKALGLAYHYKGDKEKAMEAYQQAVAENPNNDLAISNIAMIHNDKGEFVEGFKWAKRAFDLNPRHPLALKRLSEVTQVVGLENEAEELLKKGIKENPENVEFYQDLSSLYLKQNKLKEAEKYCKKVMTMEPKNREAPILMANVRLMEKNFAQAHQYFKQAKAFEEEAEEETEMDAEDRDWEVDLGIALTEMELNHDEDSRDELEDILDDLEDELEEHPRGDRLFLKSIIQASIGETEAAVKTLEKAVDHNFLNIELIVNNPAFEEVVLKNKKDIVKISNRIEKKLNKMKVEVKTINVLPNL